MKLDPGDEIVESLHKIPSLTGADYGFFHGIGAVNEVTIGFYDKNLKDYKKRTLKQDLEIVSLFGNIGKDENGNPFAHPHISLGDLECKLYGGHLFNGIISVTLELLFTTVKEPIKRVMGPYSLRLIDME